MVIKHPWREILGIGEDLLHSAQTRPSVGDQLRDLLPRLLTGRTAGPVFLGGRRPTRAVAGLDLDPTSGRARLSDRRAAELFQGRTGWSLHQLRHSALTHAAEDGTNLPLLLARSRHASVRSLERYARPGPEAVARHLAKTDPARRRP